MRDRLGACALSGFSAGGGPESGGGDGVEGPVVEGVRSQVGPVGPHDGAGLRVHRRLGEELDLAERFEDRADRPSQLRLEVDGADGAVGEADLQPVPAEVLDGADVVGGARGSGSMLTSGSSATSRSQLGSSSARCSSAHSATRFAARRGREPCSTVPVAMSIWVGARTAPAWRHRSSTATTSGVGLATVNLCQHRGERTHLQYLRTYLSRQGSPSRGHRRQRYLTASRDSTIRPGPAIRPRLLPTLSGSAGLAPPAESWRSDAEPAS